MPYQPLPFLVKATKKIVVEFPLTIFVPDALEAILNSHHIQYFSTSRLTSYEVLLLTAPHITLFCYNNLNLATLFPSITHKVPHDCLTLMDHLLTPCDGLQEIPLDNADFSWLTDVSFLKGNNG